MRRLLPLIFLSLLCIHAFPQGSLVFCQKLDENGKAIDPFESLILPPGGENIILLYRTERGPFSLNKVRLQVAMLKKYDFQNTDHQNIDVDPDDEYLSIPYKITTAGDYRFRLSGQKGELLAEEILSVSVEMTEYGGDRETVENPEAGLPAQHSELFFSGQGQDHFNTEFSFRQTGGKITLTLQPVPDTNSEFNIRIWQGDGELYDKLIRSVKLSFIREDDIGYAELVFPGIGDFKVEVLSLENSAITSAHVSFK
jgi:hypothetical protein